MQYFVTFTLLRSRSPQLFVSGRGTDGRQSIQQELTFESSQQLHDKLSAADLPQTLAEEDFSSPLLVDAEQLRVLGFVVMNTG